MQPPRLIWIDIVSCSFVVDLTFSGQPSSFPHPPPCCSFMASSDVICRFFCPYMARDDAFRVQGSIISLLLMFGSRFARFQGILAHFMKPSKDWGTPAHRGFGNCFQSSIVCFSLLLCAIILLLSTCSLLWLCIISLLLCRCGSLGLSF